MVLLVSKILIIFLPVEGYSRNASCTLNLISTFLCGLFQSTSTSTLYFTIYYLVRYVGNCIMILSSMTNKLRNFFRNQFLSTKNGKILQDHKLSILPKMVLECMFHPLELTWRRANTHAPDRASCTICLC